MRIRSVMETECLTIPMGASYEDVARFLCYHEISGAPVVDRFGNVIGAISEKDLFRILYPFYGSYYDHPELYTDLEARENKIDEIRKRPVETFMTKEVISVSPDQPSLRAGALMLAHNINRLPVMENGKLVGMVSRKHIFRNILKQHLGIEVR